MWSWLFRLGLVDIDHQVVSAAAGRDDVRLAIPVEIRDSKVFAGHVVVIDQVGAPLCALVIQGGEHFDADFHPGAIHGAPSNDDLIGARSQQVCAGDGMSIDELVVEEMTIPKLLRRAGWGSRINHRLVAVHGFHGCHPNVAGCRAITVPASG